MCIDLCTVLYFLLQEKKKRRKCSYVLVRSNIRLLAVRYEHLCLQQHTHDVFSCIYRY